MSKCLKVIIILLFILLSTIFKLTTNSIAKNNNVQNENIGVEYTSHIQDIGWQDKKSNGDTSGTEGLSLRLEAIKINLVNADENINLKYQAYIEGKGWQDAKRDGEIAGTEGESLKLEAIKIKLEGTEEYSIMYRVHIQDIGWQEWKYDDEIAGIPSGGKRIEAIQIKIVSKPKETLYNIEVGVNDKIYYNNDIEADFAGWRMANFSNNVISVYVDDEKVNAENITYSERKDVIDAIKGCGTSEQNPTPGFAVKINLEDLDEGKHTLRFNIETSKGEIIETQTYNFTIDRQPHITYLGHVQDVGWQENVSDGKIAGIEGSGLRLEALKVQLTNLTENIKLKSSAYIENSGWQEWKYDGEVIGTEGLGLKMQAIQMELEGTEEYSVMYRVYIQGKGWQEWKYDGEVAGKIDDNAKIEAIQVKIIKRDKKVRLFIETGGSISTYYNDTSTITISGWRMANFYNNEIKAYIDNTPIDGITYFKRQDVINAITGSGTERQNPTPGFSVNINLDNLQEGTHTFSLKFLTSTGEIVETYNYSFVIDRQIHVEYAGHIQDIGWQSSSVFDGALAGTQGLELRLEALKINLKNVSEEAKIKYQVHIQDIGWQDWKYDGEIAGTEGLGLRIEAIKIQLENMDEYTVEYQVHVQDVGWTDWYIDGETAGTVGESKRIEAIKIRLVPKYKRNYQGIDVSKHNGTIDWQAVKNSGIDFAIIRCGYGQNIESQDDAKFEYNVSECERLGIPYGVYLYSYALDTNNASSEADHVLRLLNGRKPQYGIWLDIEDDEYYTKYGFPTNEMFTNIVIEFCEKMKANGYDNVGIYSNLTWFNNRLNDSRLDKYDKWVAQWSSQCTYNKPYTMWQYSNKGQIDGITGDVDLDICYKRYF